MPVCQCWKTIYAHALLCWKASLIRGFSYFPALTLADPRGRWAPKVQPKAQLVLIEGKVLLTCFSAGQKGVVNFLYSSICHSQTNE